MGQKRSRLGWLAAAGTTCCLVIAVVGGLAWSSQRQTDRVARIITGGDPDHAVEILRRYGCGGCHTISGVAGADGQVGPPLAGLLHRVYVGGTETNSSDHLVQWLVNPQRFSPRSAMPATRISEAEARDVASYLYEH